MNLFERIKAKNIEVETEKARKEAEARRKKEIWEEGGVARAKKVLEELEKEVEKQAAECVGYSAQYRRVCLRVTDYGRKGREFLQKHFEKMGFKAKIDFIPENNDSEMPYPEWYALNLSGF